MTAELVLCSRDALSLTVAVVELKCAFTTVRAIAEAPAHPAPCTAKRAGMSFFEQNLVVKYGNPNRHQVSSLICDTELEEHITRLVGVME